VFLVVLETEMTGGGQEMSFHDMPYEAAGDRIEDLRREADEYRLAAAARRGRRLRARLRRTLRRRAALRRMAAAARAANGAIGALISPTWPSTEEQHRALPLRPAR
jgi:hypothetical protein